MMTNRVKSFDELSLKVVAVRAAENSDFQFEFPASDRPSTPPDLTTPLDQPGQPPLLPFAQSEGWHHGGLDE